VKKSERAVAKHENYITFPQPRALEALVAYCCRLGQCSSGETHLFRDCVYIPCVNSHSLCPRTGYTTTAEMPNIEAQVLDPSFAAMAAATVLHGVHGNPRSGPDARHIRPQFDDNTRSFVAWNQGRGRSEFFEMKIRSTNCRDLYLHNNLVGTRNRFRSLFEFEIMPAVPEDGFHFSAPCSDS